MDGWMGFVRDRLMNAVEGMGWGWKAGAGWMMRLDGDTYITRVWMDHVGKRGVLLGEGFQLAGVFMPRENPLAIDIT